MNEFKINEYITLKLEGNKTNIYVQGEKFHQCVYLAFNIPIESVQEYDDIQSIDEMVQRDRSSEFNKLDISPEQEFWGHCSNLQAWVENGYDTRLLHSNLAFPLLKKLAKLGDPIAKKVFNDEIAKDILELIDRIREYESNYDKMSSDEEFLIGSGLGFATLGIKEELENIEPEPIMPILRNLKNDESSLIRSIIVSFFGAIAKIRPELALLSLKELARDESYYIREKVAKILEELIED